MQPIAITTAGYLPRSSLSSNKFSCETPAAQVCGRGPVGAVGLFPLHDLPRQFEHLHLREIGMWDPAVSQSRL